MDRDRVYAEDVNYWRTSRTGSRTWITKAKDEIARAGGQVIGDAFASESASGRAAFSIEFVLNVGETMERFRIVWPVLPSRSKLPSAAEIQAATALYHDVKARCVAAKFLGNRTAFLPFKVLPDNRVAAQALDAEIAEYTPSLLLPSGVRDGA